MQRLLESYQRHYVRVLAAVAVLCLTATAFALGVAKGSPKSLIEIMGDLRARSLSVVNEVWAQSVKAEPVHFLQPARKPGAGITINELGASNDFVLLTGFFNGDPGLELIRRDGTVLASWPARVYDLLADSADRKRFPKTNWNIDVHGSFIEPDGSVLFNLEYQGLVKLSRCGDVVWVLPERTHHTLEPATGGGYWVAGRRISAEPADPDFYPLVNRRRTQGQIKDDLILRVDADGGIVDAKSVFDILMANGFEPLLTAIGMEMNQNALEDLEIVHLNKIVELTPDLAPAFPDFRVGDLLLSIRDYNLVLIVEPGTWKVKWHSTGPWIRQHSAQFMSDGTISVFNNNTYVHQLKPGAVSDLTQPRETNIIAIDPASGATRILYGMKPGQELLSVVRGYHHETADGGLMITEPEAGRVLEVDRSGRTLWEFINRWDETRVLEMTSGRAFPADYFTVRDWSCP